MTFRYLRDMKVIVPKAPKVNLTNVVWAVLIAVVLYLAMILLYLLWHPLVIIFSALFALAALYLIGGEILNNWLDTRK